MTPRRVGSDDAKDLSGLPDAAAMLAMRAADDAGRAAADKAAKPDEEKISLFWRVFGGTILSIAALAGVTLFNNMHATISELRAELTRANEARGQAVAEIRTEMAKAAEARADLVRKDEFNTRVSKLHERAQENQAQDATQSAAITSLKTELDGLKERLARQTADTDAVKKDAVAALEALKKDQTTATDSLKKDVAAVEVLKEKLATLSTDLKGTRDDLSKLRADVDKNQAYDLERRDRRELQCKQLEEAVKELQKGLADAREKLARVEATTAKPEPARAKQPAEPAPIPKELE